MEREIALESPAKINLFLEVLGIREDGFHEIDTLFQTVSLSDTVVVALAGGAPGVAVESDDPGLPRGEENLAGRAARALLDAAGRSDVGVRIRITKRIPAAAGLGGGSGDAATTLVALNRLLGLAWSAERLEEIGAAVGSDVPFLVRGGAARGQGRGERLTRLPSLEPVTILLAKPQVSVSTKWAYDNLRTRLTPQRPFPNMTATDTHLSVTRARDVVWNAFEDLMMVFHPSVRVARDTMAAAGAVAASMTGTGPTVFGLFPDERGLVRAEGELRSRGFWNARVVPVGERPLDA
jgi:4-diphosphocytidyl-2-C-methyl-D-erythritol kinase